MPALALDDLTVSYRRHPALHHISGSFAQGSMTALIGPNGAGKSTLLKCILGLVPVDSGRIATCPPRRRIAYLPQQSEIERDFPIVVRDCVLLGYWQSVGVFGGMSDALIARADAALLAVGLDGFAARPIGSLSAGQFQRVLFARMLLQDAELILLDEPFNAIDTKTTAALLEVIQSWHREQRTIIAVLHDYDQVQRYFPRALLLAQEVIAWDDTAKVLTESNLQQAAAMAEAQDENAALCRQGMTA